MKLIDKVNEWKKSAGNEKLGQSDEFEILVEEVKRKYKKNEICVIRYMPDRGLYIARPICSIKNCKALIVPSKNIYSINLPELKEAKSLEMIVIEDGVKTIPQYCFKDCKKLQYVHFPKTLENICSNAFENCTALKDVIYYDYVEKLRIQSEAFKGCTNLEKISLNNGCCFVGAGAFKDCKNLKSIITNGHMNICEGAFKGCNNLKYINILNIHQIMAYQNGFYFEGYVREAYNKEMQKNHSIGYSAPLEITKEEKKEIKDKNQLGR